MSNRAAVLRRYALSAKGIERRKRYHGSPKGRERNQRYEHTERGAVRRKRYTSRREVKDYLSARARSLRRTQKLLETQ